MSHVSLLEQSLDSMEDDIDHVVTKQQGDSSQVVTRQTQSARPRVTVHTALDVETASGIVHLTVKTLLPYSLLISQMFKFIGCLSQSFLSNHGHPTEFLISF